MFGRLPIFLICISAAFAAEALGPLPDAAMHGDRAVVRTLLEQHADPNATLPDGTTALHWAVRADDQETVDLLLKAGANAKVADRTGITPLYLACINGSAPMIRKLLDAGANPSSVYREGETALMTASRTGDVDAVRLLLDRGAEINAKDTHADQSALMWAIVEHHSDVALLLLDRGADAKTATSIILNFPPETGNLQGIGRAQNLPKGVVPGGMTPLLYTAREGLVDVAEKLVAKGADVNQPEANGTSPLVVAIINDHVDVAKFLVEHGADVNAADGFGRTALWSAIDVRNLDGLERTEIEREPLLDLTRLLLAHGANTNTQLKSEPPSRRWMFGFGVAQSVSQVGQTPFQRAAMAGDAAVASMLVDKGADPNLKSIAGTTGLLAATGIGWVLNQTYTEPNESFLEVVKICVEHGADVNIATGTKMTPLHSAANRGLNEVIEYLVQKGAKLDAKDSQGRTPLAYAEGLKGSQLEPKPQTVALIKKLMGE